VGLGSTGIGMAVDAGIINVDYGDNAIVDVAFSADDGVAGGFRDNDYAFVYTPAWFTRLGSGVVSAAELEKEPFIVSGFWPDSESRGAAGMPVVVHAPYPDAPSPGESNVTLIGLDTTFRGHPENSFRLLVNAIYQGLD